MLVNVLLVICLIFIVVNDRGFDRAQSVEKHEYDILRPTHYEQRVNLFSQLPITNRDVVMLGDSMVLYNEWNEQFPNVSVVNRGIGGDTTSGLLRRLENVTIGKPKSIVLMIGTNDLTMGVTQNKIQENYRLLIDRIHQESPQTSIVMTSVLPVNKTIRKTKVKNEQIEQLNRNLTALAKSENIPMLQIYDKYLKEGQMNESFTSDGIHLNGKGYSIWAKALQPYL